MRIIHYLPTNKQNNLCISTYVNYIIEINDVTETFLEKIIMKLFTDLKSINSILQ